MKKKNLPLSGVYRLLEPGPVVLLTTADKGRANVMAMSWHMMVEFEPPLIACVVSDRDYSFSALKKTREAVINVPPARLARKVVACGSHSGRGLDKFKAYGLTPAPASRVAAPLIDECHASLECKVVDTRFVPKYCIFILEVIKAWQDPARKNAPTLHHRGKGVFFAAGRIFSLPFHLK